MLKDAPPDELLAAIRTVAEGNAMLAPSVTRRLISEFAKREVESSVSVDVTHELTDREREVFALVAEGKSNKEIADELHMSTPTTKTHVSHVLMKLNARDRVQLVVIAYESGFIKPS